MSKLEQLIQELCPEGTIFQSLNQIGEFYSGLTGKSKSDFNGGNAQFVTYMNIFANSSVDLSINEKVRVEDNELQRSIRRGDILFTGSSESLEECGMSSVVVDEVKKPIYLNSFCFGFRLFDENTLIPDFSKHLFRSNNLRKQIIRTANGVTRFNVSKVKMGDVIIPLPPLPVQREIVRILDNFTELTAELTARQKQYAYYRYSLLQPNRARKPGKDDGYPKQMRIDELCNISRGRVISRASIRDNPGVFPVYSSQTENDGVMGSIDSYDYDGEYLTWTTDGANAGTVFHRDGKFSITNVCGLLKVNEQIVTTRYLYYILGSVAKNHVSAGMGNPKLMSNAMGKIKVPIPPLPEQARIVSILDRFDALCNDLSSGLPAEIEARRKQYEYYRDQLLTFKEKAS